MGIWLLLRSSVPIILQPIKISQLRLIQINALLWLVKGNHIHGKSVNLLPFEFVGAFNPSHDAACLAEVPVDLLTGGVVAELILGLGAEKREVLRRVGDSEVGGAELLAESAVAAGRFELAILEFDVCGEPYVTMEY